jgi:hypothetical protein
MSRKNCERSKRTCYTGIKDIPDGLEVCPTEVVVDHVLPIMALTMTNSFLRP